MTRLVSSVLPPAEGKRATASSRQTTLVAEHWNTDTHWYHISAHRETPHLEALYTAAPSCQKTREPLAYEGQLPELDVAELESLQML